MRAAAIAGLLLVMTGAARAEGPRLWAGPAVAIDPAFAALAGGADWFLGPRGAAGVAFAHTLTGAGDQLAAETGYGFVDLVGRLRAPLGERLRAELLGGAGAARVRFGAPGAHTEWAPDLLLGAAMGMPLGHRFELALELGTHVTLGERAAARNAAHASALVALAVRWGG
jgi:hypothetical protein